MSQKASWLPGCEGFPDSSVLAEGISCKYNQLAFQADENKCPEKRLATGSQQLRIWLALLGEEPP